MIHNIAKANKIFITICLRQRMTGLLIINHCKKKKLPPKPTGVLVVIGPCNVGPCQSLIAAVVGAKDGEKK